MQPKNLARICGAADLVYGTAIVALLLYVVPARHVVVDVMGAATALLQLASGLALVLSVPWAATAARAAAVAVLAFGVVLLVGIALSIGFLHGIYGAVGEGASAVLGLIAAVVVPYFIVFPLAQLSLARRMAARN